MRIWMTTATAAFVLIATTAVHAVGEQAYCTVFEPTVSGTLWVSGSTGMQEPGRGNRILVQVVRDSENGFTLTVKSVDTKIVDEVVRFSDRISGRLKGLGHRFFCDWE